MSLKIQRKLVLSFLVGVLILSFFLGFVTSQNSSIVEDSDSEAIETGGCGIVYPNTQENKDECCVNSGHSFWDEESGSCVDVKKIGGCGTVYPNTQENKDQCCVNLGAVRWSEESGSCVDVKKIGGCGTVYPNTQENKDECCVNTGHSFWSDKRGECIGEEKFNYFGTVEFVDIEGGCWKIVANDGVSYEPFNFNDNFKIDGLKVKFNGEVVEGGGSICQVGKLFTISKMASDGPIGVRKSIREELEETNVAKMQVREQNKVREVGLKKVQNKVQLRAGNSSVYFFGEYSFDESGNNSRIMQRLSNGRNAEIKVMPDTASERALERLRLKVCVEENNCTLELKEVGVKGNETEGNVTLAYELKRERKSKVLGFINSNMKVSAQIDAETGEVIKTKKPWWAFLASEPEEESEDE